MVTSHHTFHPYAVACWWLKHHLWAAESAEHAALVLRIFRYNRNGNNKYMEPTTPHRQKPARADMVKCVFLGLILVLFFRALLTVDNLSNHDINVWHNTQKRVRTPSSYSASTNLRTQSFSLIWRDSWSIGDPVLILPLYRSNCTNTSAAPLQLLLHDRCIRA